MFNEDACIAEGGAWLDADSCYAVDFDMSATEEECLAIDGGLWLSIPDPYGYYMNICYIINPLDGVNNEDDLKDIWQNLMPKIDFSLFYD